MHEGRFKGVWEEGEMGQKGVGLGWFLVAINVQENMKVSFHSENMSAISIQGDAREKETN